MPRAEKVKTRGPIPGFTILRRRWLRGGRGGDSCLYSESSRRMCCLGIYLRACGFSVGGVKERSMPGDVEATGKRVPSWMVTRRANNFIRTSPSNMKLAVMNDNSELSEKKRERKIQELFASQGIKVTFK